MSRNWWLVGALLAAVPLAENADDELLSLGEALFQRGEIAAGSSVAIGTPPIPVAAELFACGNCHGSDGRGLQEAGVVAPELRWSRLSRPYPVLAGRFRLRPAYDRERFVQALRDGVDSAGQQLATAMPRYRLSEREISALIAYLQALDEGGDSRATIAIGVRLPLAQQPAAQQRNHAMRAVLEAYVAHVGDRGGIFQRRLELHLVDAGVAFMQPLLAGLDLAFDELAPAPDDRVPVISLFDAAPADTAAYPTPRFALYAGASARAEVLRRHARQTLGADPWQLTVAASATMPQLPSPAPAAVLYDGDEARLLGQWLPALPADVVLLLSRWLETPALIRLTEEHIGPVYVAVPPTVELAGAAGHDLLLRVGATRPLPREHNLAQLWTLAAARALTAALEQAGPDADARRLVEVLESWYRHDIGFGPPLTFSAGRRTGARGAVVLQLRRGGGVERWRWLDLDQPEATDPPP